MVRAFVIAALAVVLMSSPAAASAPDLEVKKSPHSVSKTLDLLTEALHEWGIAVAARIDHADAAAKAGVTLRPTAVLIFDNPRLGTPLMQGQREIGLDLPMKVLAWEDEEGQVWLAYTKPEVLKQRYGVEGQDQVFESMAVALDTFTMRAIFDE